MSISVLDWFIAARPVYAMPLPIGPRTPDPTPNGGTKSGAAAAKRAARRRRNIRKNPRGAA